MAIQTGIITLSGRIGNVVHYERDGVNCSRTVAEKYALTEATKKSGAEFGKASAAGALIRKGMEPIIKRMMHSKLVNKINKRLIKIINTGPVALKGDREVIDGDVALLKDLEFNPYSTVGRLTFLLPTMAIDPMECIRFMLPRMEMSYAFNPPPKAAFGVLQLICCTYDFPAKNGRFARPDELVIPLNKKVFPGADLELPLYELESCVLLVGMGVYFLTAENIPIGNRQWYGGNIVEAVAIKDGKVVQFEYPPLAAPVPVEEKKDRVVWKLREEEGRGSGMA